MTPWAPIAIGLLATTGVGLLVAGAARDAIAGLSIGILVMAAFLVLLAQIATVAYVPAAILATAGLIGLGAAGLDRARGQSK